MATYCTIEQAKSAGARGSDAEITAAIERASLRVSRYTGETFEPVAKTKRVKLGRDGRALVHERIVSVTAVRWAGVQQPIGVDGYRVESSIVDGVQDAIVLAGSQSWADVTVLGAEPWAGGWAGLSSQRRGDEKLDVEGTFGWATAPEDVAEATALVAAHLREGDELRDELPAESEQPNPIMTDDEGNVLPVVPPFENGTEYEVERAARLNSRARSRTTGVVEADVLLASYVREPVRFRA